MSDELLAVAKVGRSHGLKGEFRVWMLTEGADTLEHVSRIVMLAGDGRREEFRVGSLRAAPRGLLLRVEGIRFRDQADAWKHAIVHIYAADLPDLPEDEWYEFELLDRPVVDVHGVVMGVVDALMDNGGHDVLVVGHEDGSEFQIPFVDGMVEVEEARVVVDPPEGLIDATRGVRTRRL